MKQYAAGVFALSLFLYLLLFPVPALTAVRDGLLLWYHSVLPVLFPFMILSGCIIRLRLTELLPAGLLSPLCRLFGCSPHGCFAVITGYLCGFPIGARVTRDLQSRHLISDQEAEHLYGFTNNVSPAFLASFLALEQLGMPRYRPFFLFCVLGASILYGILTSPRKSPFSPSAEPDAPRPALTFSVVDACIQDGIRAAVMLGAYITVFSLLSSAAGSLLPSGSVTGAAVSGLLEITGGAAAVARLDIPADMKAVWLCAVCAFGGLSAFAQTVSIASMTGPTIRRYLKSRVTITLLASLLSLVISVLRRLFLC